MATSEAWAAELAARWRVETASGVTVYPTSAAVGAMENLGVDMREAAPLLRDAEDAFARRDWSRLATALARVNGVIAARLPSVREGEPETWDEYRATVPGGAPGRARFGVSSGASTAARSGMPVDYDDRVRGAWIGKCIGTALGDPVEGWTRERIAAEHAPISGYLVPPKVENDDTAYPILVLHALDEHGTGFTSADLALEWVAHLPLAFT
ncbi:MAG: ADP-ribosylglycohydrolase family protein, partial [Candidatus Bipolaricaulota bacterium]|nr:ADP-ribosylglycohydrolase family protein [Candidatus Bipolaricaulota bacterium]